MAGTDGGFYSPKDPQGRGPDLNHFSLLSIKPGVIRSPEIVIKHLKNHNTSTSMGVSAQGNFGKGPVKGSGSGGYQNKDVRGENRATVTDNVAIETKADISKLNRKVSNISEETSRSETKVKVFVPIVTDFEKAWNNMMSNASAAMDKPWTTPALPEKPVHHFIGYGNQEEAWNRREEMREEILRSLIAQGATRDEMKVIYDSEDINGLLNKSCGYYEVSSQDKKPGELLQIDITEGQVDPLDRCLRIMSNGAAVLSDFAEKHPTLVGYSMTAIQFALGGPAGFARDQVCEAVGVHDAVDAVTSVAKGWFSNQLQDRLGVDETYADVYSEAGAFGIMIGLGTFGGASKDKILEAAKDVREKARVFKKVESYEVGTYKNLAARSKNDGLEIHHVPQQHVAKQGIEGYDPKIAPAIVLPAKEHKKIPNKRGINNENPRDFLAEDVRNLRNYTNTPNDKIKELVDLTKTMYKKDFSK